MHRLLLSAATYFGLTAAALAVPITGELSINGSDTIVSASSSAFDITFQNPGNIGGTSGSFQTAFGVVPPQLTGAVTMISELTDTSANFELYSATVGAVTSTLEAANITNFVFGPVGSGLESLGISGAGTLTLSGFDPTPGFFDLTTQGLTGVEVTFSSTQIASGVAEPTALALLGTALIGWGLLFPVWRKRRDAAAV